MSDRSRTQAVVWFLGGAVPALALGLVLGPMLSHLALERTVTTAELVTVSACALLALCGSIGGWVAASTLHRSLLKRDLETARSWIELVGRNGFDRAAVHHPTSPTLRTLLAPLDRAGAAISQQLDDAHAKVREMEAHAAHLAKVYDELEQVNYIITHHLHEPLIRITTYLDMFGRQMRGRLDPPATRFLESVHSGVKRIEVLIEDLTLYSRSVYGPPDLYEVDTQALVLSVIETLDIEAIEAGARIDVGELPSVWANPDELTKVFRHLIANAIRYRRGDAPKIEVRAQRADGKTIFEVQDNGIGIDPHYQRSLFTVFERVHTDAAYVGSGIGLAVCKKVIEHHGGEIAVRSVLGEGSTFTFSIPDYRPPSAPRPNPEKRVH